MALGQRRDSALASIPGLPYLPPSSAARRVVIFGKAAAVARRPLRRQTHAPDNCTARHSASVRGSTRLSTMSSSYQPLAVPTGDQAISPLRPAGLSLARCSHNIGGLPMNSLVRSMYTEAVNHAPA